MSSKLRKLIRESIETTLLCEVKMDISDEKNRGFADQVGQMYKASLAELKPTKIHGKLGAQTSGGEASVFEITLSNGDIIQATRITNPAFAHIVINGTNEYTVYSNELFSNKFPDIIKKYYLEYKTAKAGIPSI
jgi:hypothetical protein